MFGTITLTLSALCMVGLAVSARRSAEVSQSRARVFLAVAVLVVVLSAASWVTLLV